MDYDHRQYIGYIWLYYNPPTNHPPTVILNTAQLPNNGIPVTVQFKLIPHIIFGK